ncbi:MAG TPA: SRPBCC domain-containing protein [Patescibacteria group bacterium]|nr:SRPBCC domain-containing protein [Patescibacteria group bacterium]
MSKQTVKKSIEINASKEKIWDVLLQDETYRKWTSAFHEGSYAEGDFSEGSTVRFLGPEGDGMVSKVAVHKPNDTITFEHQGMILKGKEDFDSPEVQDWKGFLETYTVTENGGISRLDISCDTAPKWYDSFDQMWTKALASVKELAEN